MNELIACCGLNCNECEARIATLNNDNELREKTAEKWRVQYGVPQMTAEMINCTGCRMDGAKLGHCNECEIRNCVKGKAYNTCADCPELEKCPIVQNILRAVPEAKANLKRLVKGVN